MEILIKIPFLRKHFPHFSSLTFLTFLFRLISKSNHKYWVSSMGEKYKLCWEPSWSTGEWERLNDIFHARRQKERKIAMILFDLSLVLLLLGFRTFRADDWCSHQIRNEWKHRCWMSNDERLQRFTFPASTTFFSTVKILSWIKTNQNVCLRATVLRYRGFWNVKHR